MRELSLIIVDDNQAAIDYIAYELQTIPCIKILATFTSAVKALEYLKEQPVDCALLDIEMPSINGISVAAAIEQCLPKIYVIFITAFEQYAVEAFEVRAKDYLLKPVKRDKLIIALDKVRSLLPPVSDSHKTRLRVMSGEKFAISIDDNPLKLPSGTVTEVLKLLFIRGRRHAFSVSKDIIIDEVLYSEGTELAGLDLRLRTLMNRVRKFLKKLELGIELRNNVGVYFLTMSEHVEVIYSDD